MWNSSAPGLPGDLASLRPEMLDLEYLYRKENVNVARTAARQWAGRASMKIKITPGVGTVGTPRKIVTDTFIDLVS